MFDFKWISMTCAICLTALLGVAQSDVANAVQTAEQMTCDQAKAFYQRNGYIYKIVGGVPTRIQRGGSILDAGAVRCTGRTRNQMTYSVPTRDRRRCTVSTYCTG